MTSLSASFSHSVPILLLPPSEGKAPGGRLRTVRGERGVGWDPADGRFSELAPRRLELAQRLAETGGGTEKLLGVRGDHLARALSANSSLLGAPVLPAWQRYTGVVWEHLAPDELPSADRRRIVVVSGLLGLVRGDDPVPDYRLKMGASIAPFGVLARWWRDDLSAALRAEAGRRMVVDLLPQEHRAAWTGEGVRGVRVEFVDPSGAPGGHGAKAAKGRLARAVLEHGPTALDDWSDDRFDLVVTRLDA